LAAVRYAHIHITTNNQAPIATGESYSILPNGRLTLSAPGPLANDFDPDGDAIQFVLVNGPTWGSLTITPDGQLTYLPGSRFASLDTIRYRVTDGRLYSETVEIQITTLAVPIQEIFLPPSSAGETKSSLQNDYVGNLSEGSTNAATGLGGADSVSINASIGGKSSPIVTESTILAGEYVAQGVLNERSSASERRLEGVGWKFEQTFINVADVPASFSQQLQSLSDEIFASIASSDSQNLLNTITDLKLGTAIITTANATLSAATAGTVFWTLRGAALVATLVSGMPALRNLDPAKQVGTSLSV
jgi:hypothetical protein